MSYDETVAAAIRGDLAAEPGLTERRMFGGLAFMLHGNMVAGVHRDGGFFRVGKAAAAEAMEVPGTQPMTMGGTVMGGFVDATAETVLDAHRRSALLRLARQHAAALPPK